MFCIFYQRLGANKTVWWQLNLIYFFSNSSSPRLWQHPPNWLKPLLKNNSTLYRGVASSLHYAACSINHRHYRQAPPHCFFSKVLSYPSSSLHTPVQFGDSIQPNKMKIITWEKPFAHKKYLKICAKLGDSRQRCDCIKSINILILCIYYLFG